MSFHLNLRTCHACPLRCRESNACLGTCTVDGRGIVAHAEAHDCPRYDARGLGDVVAKVIHFLKLDVFAKFWAKATGKPCGCKERQDAWNAVVPFGKS